MLPGLQRASDDGPKPKAPKEQPKESAFYIPLGSR